LFVVSLLYSALTVVLIVSCCSSFCFHLSFVSIAIEVASHLQGVFFNEIYLAEGCGGSPLIRNRFECGQCTAVALAGISIRPNCEDVARGTTGRGIAMTLRTARANRTLDH
jgi:hypothetical protein